MKVKFVVDQLPYPPRNGITIPIWGYLRLMAKNNSIDLVILCDEEVDIPTLPERLVELCSSISVVRRTRRSKFVIALHELLLHRASFVNYKYGAELTLIGVPSRPDVALASPIGCIDYIARAEPASLPVISGISDLYISVISDSANAQLRAGRLLAGLLNRMRYTLLRYLEGKALRRASVFLVQTDRDREWSKKLYPPDLWTKAFVLPNGVGPELSLPKRTLPAPEPRILFITSHYIPLYADAVRWIVKNVWKDVQRRVPDARFTLIGRGLTDHSDLARALEVDPSLEYLPYVEDLSEIYRRTRVLVVKINKSYGFINKVAEALAMGIPVVGDQSAFNGLESATSAGAAFAAGTAAEMTARIVELLSNDVAWISAARLAQNEIGPSLRWEEREDLIRQAVALSVKGGCL